MAELPNSNQFCITTLKPLAGLVDRIARDERKMDNEMKELLRMDARNPVVDGDARKPVVDRVRTAIKRSEAYVHKNQPHSILRP